MHPLSLPSSSPFGKQNLYDTVSLRTFSQPQTEPQIRKTVNRFVQASAQAISEGLQVLVAAGAVKSLPRQRYIAKQTLHLDQGHVDYVHPDYAYIVLETHQGEKSCGDVRIRTSHLRGAVHLDTVQILWADSKRGAGRVGVVLRVSRCPGNVLVGSVERRSKGLVFVPDGRRWHVPIRLDPHRSKGVKPQDKAACKLHPWHDKTPQPFAFVSHVLGPAGTHEAEMNALLLAFDLPDSFPKEALLEAECISPLVDEGRLLKQRRDMRDRLTCTIDPHDAQDFDDALSYRRISDHRYEIGVHIADVSHYVPEGSELDKEAFTRGVSVYLVDRVIPMLPEKLANDLCSLRPHVPRLAFSAVFEMDEAGKVYKQWFGETLIRSDRRFTYEEAQEVLNRPQGPFGEALGVLQTLSASLRKKRFAKGAVDIHAPEVEVRLNDQGDPVHIGRKKVLEAHQLIEEWMLVTGRHVAEWMSARIKCDENAAFVYRVHDAPDPEKMTYFLNVAKHLGYQPKTQKNNAKVEVFNGIRQAFQGASSQHILQMLAVRTMSKAFYSVEPRAHFGLAFRHYTHFTSPIRRYADLVSHRLLKRCLAGQSSIDPSILESCCRQTSERERIAAEAERASIKHKQVVWMQRWEGKTVQGLITSVCSWGLYVELEMCCCEGMVRFSSMRDDCYQIDDKGYKAIGRRHRRTYAVGDTITVFIQKCNAAQRTIDLVLAQVPKNRRVS